MLEAIDVLVGVAPFLTMASNRIALATALVGCSCVSDRDRRKILIGLLESFNDIIPLTETAIDDAHSILKACADEEARCRQLFEAVDALENQGQDKSKKWRNVEDTVRQIINPLFVPAHELDELLEGFGPDAVPLAEILAAYNESLPAGAGPAPGIGTIAAAVSLLSDEQAVRPSAPHPMLEFVERIAVRVTDAKLQHRLQQWSKKTADRIKVPVPELLKLRAKLAAAATERSARHAVVVELRPVSIKGGEHYFLRMVQWRNRDPVGDPVETAEPVSLEQARQHIHQALSDLDRRLGKDALDLVLEFCVPRRLLEWDVETWVLGPGNAVPVGLRYPVVVRWHALADSVERLRAPWEQRWDRLQPPAPQPAVPVFWLDSANQYPKVEQLYACLTVTADFLCLALTFPPGFRCPLDPAAVDIVATCFGESGVPVALWFRKPIATARKEIETVLGAGSLWDLPGLVRSARRRAAQSAGADHPGRALTLYWDDPYRQPSGAFRSRR
jgi:hypothetical protein